MPHAGLDSDEIDNVIEDEAAGAEKVRSYSRDQIDGVIDLWDLALDVVVHASKKNPFLHVGSEAAFFVPEFRKFLVRMGLKASNLE